MAVLAMQKWIAFLLSGYRKVIVVHHNWATAQQNQQNDLCAQRRFRSAWESAQSDQSLRCPNEETLAP